MRHVPFAPRSTRLVKTCLLLVAATALAGPAQAQQAAQPKDTPAAANPAEPQMDDEGWTPDQSEVDDSAPSEASNEGQTWVPFADPDKVGWDDPGPYMIIAGLNSFEHFQDTGEDFTNSWGFAARGGYRLNKWLAVEGALEFLSGYDVNVALAPPPPGASADLTVDGGNGGANVKLYAPWFGRLQPYGLLGIGGMWAELRTTYPTGYVCDPIYWYCSGTYTQLGHEGAFLAKFGGGAEFWLSQDFALVVEAAFNLPTGDLKDLRATNLIWGGVFRF